MTRDALIDSRDQGAQQYLTFHIAGESYGVSITGVREIIPYEPLTRVPTTPAWIRGVLSLRGGVVPVVDLAVKLGMPERPIGPSTCVVIAEIELDDRPAVMGLLTDSVDEVVELTPGQIETAPALPTHTRIEAIQGLARVGSKLVLLLDIEKALTATGPPPPSARPVANEVPAAARETPIAVPRAPEDDGGPKPGPRPRRKRKEGPPSNMLAKGTGSEKSKRERQ
jgi:purine-binding chemotaxis protein CheW